MPSASVSRLLTRQICYHAGMVKSAAKKGATYEDLLKIPSSLVAQLVDGELVTQPRPSALHALAASALGEELGPPFKRGKGGPGGWVILDEPELHLGQDVLVPDLAGWRRERMPQVQDVAHFEVVPNWVCEVLSPSTEAFDRTRKLQVYARERVDYLWFINPRNQTLEILQSSGDLYQLLGTYCGQEVVNAKPFEAIALDLTVLWAR